MRRKQKEYAMEIGFGNHHSNQFIAHCFDEDSELYIATGQSKGYSLSVDEVKDLIGFLTYHLKCQTEK